MNMAPKETENTTPGADGERERTAPFEAAPQHRIGRPRFPLGVLAVAVLAGIPFALGKYFEVNSPEPFDGGSYLYSAQRILNGAKIGVEEIPSAHPGTLFVNMLSIKLFGYRDISPKILQGILQAAALIVMFLTLRRLWGTLAAGVSVVVASTYLSAPVIAKYGNVKEQFMIVFMVLGVCCLLWQQLNSRSWCGLLAGAFLVWAPMFKPTGISAAAGAGLFVLLQPLLKNRSWRQMGMDLLLLIGGAVAAMAPLYIWIRAGHVQMALPYWFLADFIVKHLPGGRPAGAEVVSDYVSASHALMPYKELVPRVMRYYMVLILPIAMAVAAIMLRIGRWGWSTFRGGHIATKEYERFVLVLGVWWILDMAFIWISAHSYEQYYLPLTASGAMLGGYVVALYQDRLKPGVAKVTWYTLGSLALFLMLILSRPVLFGLRTSPYSGTRYPAPTPRNGYQQKLAETRERRRTNLKGPWEHLSLYIKNHSEPNDPIYVWGWYPGIYVLAERVSPTPSASEGTMHTLTPRELAARVAQILAAFEKRPPKFIVDSYKPHFPFNRPPLELWPRVPSQPTYADQNGFLKTDPAVVQDYERLYGQALGEKIDPDEARRFEAMKPFRDYVMRYYRPVGRFETHVLYQRQ